MANILPITKARETLTDLVDKTSKLYKEFIITVNGKPTAVLLSVDEYESLKETADVLSDKNLIKQLLKSEKEITRGKYVTFEELKKELKL
jgi:prevent-host-death family protein